LEAIRPRACCSSLSIVKKSKASGSGWAQLSDGNCVQIRPVGHFESQLFSGGQFCFGSSLSGGIQSTLSNNNEQLEAYRAIFADADGVVLRKRK
jgi:hypothetical protein